MNNAEQKFHVGDLIQDTETGRLGIILKIEEYEHIDNQRDHYLIHFANGQNTWLTDSILIKAVREQ